MLITSSTVQVLKYNDGYNAVTVNVFSRRKNVFKCFQLKLGKTQYICYFCRIITIANKDLQRQPELGGVC